jgi:hypothetical protein
MDKEYEPEVKKERKQKAMWVDLYDPSIAEPMQEYYWGTDGRDGRLEDNEATWAWGSL